MSKNKNSVTITSTRFEKICSADIIERARLSPRKTIKPSDTRYIIKRERRRHLKLSAAHLLSCLNKVEPGLYYILVTISSSAWLLCVSSSQSSRAQLRKQSFRAFFSVAKIVSTDDAGMLKRHFSTMMCNEFINDYSIYKYN